jgi:hypothetical protein
MTNRKPEIDRGMDQLLTSGRRLMEAFEVAEDAALHELGRWEARALARLESRRKGLLAEWPLTQNDYEAYIKMIKLYKERWRGGDGGK